MITDAAQLPPSVDLHALIALFYERSAELGRFSQQSPDQLPPDYRRLLAHHDHMTVTVENYHQSLVDVHVFRTRLDDNLYAREITLSRASDDRVVQYGIVRLNREFLKPHVWQEIVGEKIPLGRVLIQHDVLREVVLEKLWRVECAEALARFLNVESETVVYGRTAMIFCDNEPAIELLEIVVA
ncbi:MAG: hypothetical protein R3C05_12485 [Pirellulaceae bacterium]